MQCVCRMQRERYAVDMDMAVAERLRLVESAVNNMMHTAHLARYNARLERDNARLRFEVEQLRATSWRPFMVGSMS